jgi:GrpB-like predicted nucleotidyltransferase (UPF0157 family)
LREIFSALDSHEGVNPGFWKYLKNMLSSDEQNYLDHLSPEKAREAVIIKPYDSRLADIARNIIQNIQAIIPDADVRFMGASALGISGQNDIDIYILGLPYKLDDWITKIKESLGERTNGKWQFDQDGFEVSIYIADPEDPNQKKQIEVFEKLKENPSALQDYEKLKESMNGKSYKNYQTAKYEFYQKLLNNT